MTRITDTEELAKRALCAWCNVEPTNEAMAREWARVKDSDAITHEGWMRVARAMQAAHGYAQSAVIDNSDGQLFQLVGRNRDAPDPPLGISPLAP